MEDMTDYFFFPRDKHYVESYINVQVSLSEKVHVTEE